MQRSLQKYHPTQLWGMICCETPFQRRRQTPGWLKPSSKMKTTEPHLPTGETTRSRNNRYSQFIQEFVQIGHMEEVHRNKIHVPATNCFYLPRHCVIKDASSTTKLRVVFDASAKSTSGVSLNDRLMVGPQLQKVLFGILIRFRFHQVALSADIAKMYRQVQLDDEDKDFHSVSWKNPSDTELKTYRMTRVTYGIASSSYHSIRPLTALADSCANSNLRLAINHDMYVDDLITGASDVEHATQLQHENIATMKTACFDILKWTSSVSSLV